MTIIAISSSNDKTTPTITPVLLPSEFSLALVSASSVTPVVVGAGVVVVVVVVEVVVVNTVKN